MSFGANWIRTQDRDGEQPAEQRPVHVQRSDDRPRPCRLHARPHERLPPGQSGVRLRRERLLRRLHPGRMEAAREPDASTPALRWEPYLPIKNTLGYVSNFDKARFDQGIRSRVYPQAPPGSTSPAMPVSRERGDELQAGAVRAAHSAWCGAPDEADRVPRRVGHASTTRRTCSSTRASPTIRRGARRSR